MTEAIARYSPRSVPTDVWRRIEILVRTWVRQAEPGAVYEAQYLLNVVTQLALWVEGLGQPLELEIVFHPDTIDRFAREALTHLKAGTRNNYRTMARVVGAAVLGPPLYQPRVLPLQRSDIVHPYSPDEVARLLAWHRGLRTDRYRDNVGVLLAHGLGAGLTSDQVRHHHGADTVRDAHGVLVQLQHPTARDVPVLRRWEDEVADIADRAGPGLVFLPNLASDSIRKVPNFIARVPKGDAPPLNMIRLRVTWMVHHLSAGTDIAVLSRAAGVAPHQLVKYLDFVPETGDAEARCQLREATAR